MIGRTRGMLKGHRSQRGLWQTGLAKSSPRPDGYFRALAETVAGAVVVVDRLGRIRFFSAGAEAMTGFTAGEILGKPVQLLLVDVPPGGAPGEGTGRPAQLRTRRGSLRPVELRTAGGGRLPAGEQILMLTDLTPPKHARPEETHGDAALPDQVADRYWLWETDAAHRISHVSDSFSAVAGCPAGDLLGMPVEKLAGLFGNEPAWQALRHAMEQQGPIEGRRFRVREPGGSYRLFSLSGRPVRSDAGSFAGYRGAICDITALLPSRRQELRRADRLWNAAAACGTGLALFDPAGRLAMHNGAFAELFFPEAPSTVQAGLSYEAFARAYIETHLGITSPDSLRECVALELARHRKGGRPVLRRLADRRWICSVDTALPDGSVIGVHVDISAFITRDVACRDRDRYLLEIVQHLAGAIVATDPDGRIGFINAPALRLFGYAAHEVVGRPIGMLVPDRPAPPADAPRRSGVDPQLQPPGTGIFTATGRRKDGTALDLEVMRSEMRVGEQCHLLRVIRERSPASPARQSPGGMAAGNSRRSDLVA